MGAGASAREDVNNAVCSLLEERVHSLVQAAAAASKEREEVKLPLPRLVSKLSRGDSLGHGKSLRSMALRTYSRQENTYILPQELMSASSLSIYTSSKSEKKDKGGGGVKDLMSNTSSSSSSSSGSLSSSGSGKGSFKKPSPPSSHSNVLVVVEDLQQQQQQQPAAQVRQQGKMGGMIRPNLKINIQDDEADWIQVSDDEAGDDNDANSKQPRVSLSQLPAHAQQSYLFTQSGTIFVDGFVDGIGKGGIRSANNASQLPLHDRLVVICRLGAGASGIVYKALDLVDMRLVALKMIPMFERAKRRQMVRELSALFQMLRQKREEEESRVDTTVPPAAIPETNETIRPTFCKKRQNEFIVDFYDAFSNIDEGGVALMMEYMDGGSLQDIVNDGGCDDEATLANIAMQGLEGLAFLHSCAQLHRDLKPGNFLISHRGDVKIADFGILKQMSSEPSLPSSPSLVANSATEGIPRTQTFVGTATYMSPERIDGKEYSYPSDIWSFGLSLLTLALGKLPIDTRGGYWTILQSIRDEKPPAVPEDGRFSPEFKDFIDKCLFRNPNDRQTAEVLLSHPFLNKASYEQDLEDEQIDMERGLSELQDILSALCQHLVYKKAEHSKSNHNGNQQSPQCDLTTKPSLKDDLSTILLDTSQFSLSSLLDRLFSLDEPAAAKRFSFLATQLHLSSSMLLDSIKIVCAKLVSTHENPLFASTPKAAHHQQAKK